MRDIHITRELLRASERGEVPDGTVLQILSEHVAALCPTCYTELLAHFAEEETPVGLRLDAMSAVLQHMSHEAETIVQAHETAERNARRELAELLRLDQPQRLAKMACAWERFRSPELAELLLQECRRRAAQDPQLALELASLVTRHPWETPTGSNGPVTPQDHTEYAVRGLAHQANAQRVQGDLVGASITFAEVRERLRYSDLADPCSIAEIESLEGSLRLAQCNFREAERLLLRAHQHYSIAHDAVAAARTTMKLAGLYRTQGQPDKALDVLAPAVNVLAQEHNLRLSLYAQHNYADCLCDVGRFSEAEGLLTAITPLYRQLGEPANNLRRVWLLAKIARGLDRSDEAEAHYLAVRDGFLDLELGYDAALVSLELAAFYLDQDRGAEVRRLATQTFPMFRSLGVHREALAALAVFEQAAEREQATLTLTQAVRSYLERARCDPSRRFVGPR